MSRRGMDTGVGSWAALVLLLVSSSVVLGLQWNKVRGGGGLIGALGNPRPAASGGCAYMQRSRICYTSKKKRPTDESQNIRLRTSG